MSVVVGICSAGYMGAGLGWALREGGARVVTSVAGRSGRTARLAASAGLEVLPGLGDVVAAADVLLIVTPPGEALAAARSIAPAKGGATPLVADLNAVSPETLGAIESAIGLPLVDGAISGPPPNARPGARLFLSGERAAEIADLPWAGRIEPIVVGERTGSASALKMCTASVYKGLTALVTQAMRTAGHHDVLDHLMADLARNGLDDSAGVAVSATKAHRFVGEMREIAATQAGAGLTPALFGAMAEVYAGIARTRLAAGDPETTDRAMSPAEIVSLSKEVLRNDS